MIHRHIRSNLFCYVLLKCLYIPFLTLFPKLMKHYKQKAQFEPQRKQSNARLKIQRRQKVNMTHQNRWLSWKDKKNSLWRTHNVKDESTKHECVAETKTQLALQFKQSKSKIFLRRDKGSKMMTQKNLSCRERKPKLSCNSSDQNLWSKS